MKDRENVTTKLGRRKYSPKWNKVGDTAFTIISVPRGYHVTSTHHSAKKRKVYVELKEGRTPRRRKKSFLYR